MSEKVGANGNESKDGDFGFEGEKTMRRNRVSCIETEREQVEEAITEKQRVWRGSSCPFR
jgi:hypothetical protein